MLFDHAVVLCGGRCRCLSREVEIDGREDYAVSYVFAEVQIGSSNPTVAPSLKLTADTFIWSIQLDLDHILNQLVSIAFVSRSVVH